MSSSAKEQRVIDMWAAMVNEITKSMGVRPEGDEMIAMRACANVALRRDQLVIDFIRAADDRMSGQGDFESYHAARHDLVMALGGDL